MDSKGRDDNEKAPSVVIEVGPGVGPWGAADSAGPGVRKTGAGLKKMTTTVLMGDGLKRNAAGRINTRESFEPDS